jgi:hypothetical protein
VPAARKQRRTRHAILAGLAGRVVLSERQRRQIMRDGGADGLDAVLAGQGGVAVLARV